jgi:3-dehydroquinate synthase
MPAEPNAPQTVRVNLSERGYDIEIGGGNLSAGFKRLLDERRITHAVVISDENVAPLYASAVLEALRHAGARADLATVPAGETSKSVASAQSLWQKMLDCGADRKTVVVALGGGVVGDLAGFVAATYGRGVPFVQAPTTLLAQVDSSVGGKVGVNLPGAKNMVGAFWQPWRVVIDTDTLHTLPQREYRAGLAEVVKYGVILDADFFSYLEGHVEQIERREGTALRAIVARCCRLKADVVESDERETTGARAVLNYGHTFCHAFEAATGYGALLHGEAVSIGMICASRLAERLGRVDAGLTARQHALLTALGLPTDVPDVSHDELLALMSRDKKVEHGRLRFVLPSRMGHVELVGDIDEADVRAALG